MNFPITRNRNAETYLEFLLISAVTTILGVRFFLHITNYPQVGGAGLHIAHMLWGGLFMIASIVLLLSFLNKSIYLAATIAGGIGFGLFIDELGKFITKDNDYFFEPAIAIIYIVFILLYLAIRLIQKQPAPHPSEGIAVPKKLQDIYVHLLEKKLVIKIVIAVFTLHALIDLYNTLDIISLFFRLSEFSLSFTDWGELLSVFISTTLVVIGIVRLKFSRLAGYKLFQYALLVSIFFTQFFNFYKVQLSAVSVLLFNIVMLFAIKFIIQKEERIIAS